MARRTYELIDVTEILEHWHAGRSQAEIAASLRVDRKTVRKYTAPAIAAGLTPGGAPVPEEQWVDLARQWFPELTDTRLRQSSWPAIERFHEFVREQVGTVTISTVHQRLRDEHGLTVSLSSLRRYVAANLPAEAAAAAITVLGEDPPPGREGHRRPGGRLMTAQHQLEATLRTLKGTVALVERGTAGSRLPCRVDQITRASSVNATVTRSRVVASVASS